MKAISEKQVDLKREEILETIKNPLLTHEQKVTALARHAENFLSVLDEPKGIDELMRCDVEDRCICNLFEGEAPYRPRYICPDYQKFMKNGSKFLDLPAPSDLDEALNSLLILYHNVPSITNYPVYVGNLDVLIEPFLENVDDQKALKAIKLFYTAIDRTIVDSFCHANIGPLATRAGKLIMQVESELENAVPNLTMRVAKDTPDDFILAGIDCALHSAKPSFANDTMYRDDLGDSYCISSCYNALLEGGGAYTLSRLILSKIAKRSKNKADFFENVLPFVLKTMSEYMDCRINFLVEQSGFFQNNFLSQEGLISKSKFTAMYGMVGLGECVNILMEKEGKSGRFGNDQQADDLGVEIMEYIQKYNDTHKAPHCEATGDRYLLHAQVGIDKDVETSPGVRIPIGDEPENIALHLKNINRFHKYFRSGVGDIFPVDITVNKNPKFVLDIIRGSFDLDIRFLSFYRSDSDVIRVTGYLVKRSEIEKLAAGNSVLQNTTGLGYGAALNCKVNERKVR